MNATRRAFAAGILVCLAAGCDGADGRVASNAPSDEASVAFAKCLTDRGWVLYSSSTCSACRTQREAFGAAFSHVIEIECNPHAPGADTERCLERGIRRTPTWIAEREGRESERIEGYRSLEKLAKATGCHR